ncbi:MAG TPA: hypothetical protein VFT45_08640 [Longimicrobium sp.]|nr:hypothetical protein [Longimicrobium sp.]
MRIRRLLLLLLTLQLTACGRAAARDADAPDTLAAADSVPLPLAPNGDSVEVVEHVGQVAVEQVWSPAYGQRHIRQVRVKVDGRDVLVDDESRGMRVVSYWTLESGGRTLVVLGSTFGGTACERTFIVLDVRADSSYVSRNFGSCASWPDTMWFDRAGALWMRFPSWAPFRAEIQPGFVPGPPETYVYRGEGRVEKR